MSSDRVKLSRWWIVAAVVGALGVALGAFGAHGLESASVNWPARAGRLERWEVAVRYHMYHALALCAIAALATWRPSRLINAAGLMFLLGVMLFSGFLYGYVLVYAKQLAIPVPIGGVFLILGWVLMAVAAVKK